MKYLPFYLSFLLCFNKVYAQVDSSFVFGYETFIERVLEHHPIALQLPILQKRAEAAKQMARGAFDPKAFGGLNQKQFGSKQYYIESDAGLKIPTWFGIEGKAGYEQNQGVFLDPSRTVPQAGLWYAGIAVQLGKGFFIDKRRADLKKAKLLGKATEQQQIVLLNNLLYEAGKAYWDWANQHQHFLIYQEALKTAAERFKGVRKSAYQGDKALIDTLKAYVQVQNRLMGLNNAKLGVENSRAELSVFLWQEGVIPLELDADVAPELLFKKDVLPISIAIKEELIELAKNHPDLKLAAYKIQESKIDFKLNKEGLKPKIDLNYNLLREPSSTSSDFEQINLESYKWGVNVNIPIFLRKERGKLKISKLKISEQELAQKFKAQQVMQKMNQSINGWNNAYKQLDILSNQLKHYESLLNAEERLFEIGESSLFLVNTRDVAFIEAQIKYNSMIYKYQKSVLKTYFTSGRLINFIRN